MPNPQNNRITCEIIQWGVQGLGMVGNIINEEFKPLPLLAWKFSKWNTIYDLLNNPYPYGCSAFGEYSKHLPLPSRKKWSSKTHYKNPTTRDRITNLSNKDMRRSLTSPSFQPSVPPSQEAPNELWSLDSFPSHIIRQLSK
jgi:hypothetical protein